MTDSPKAKLYIDTQRAVSDISPLLFSGFAEHMGRAIYEGIYDPASPHADENGLRKDVLAALRELNFRSMRYPGGNFLSGYRWEDGIGPKDQRPTRRDLAWQSIETNQFGTDEFMHFCQEIGTDPMMAVNMGTGSIQDAANLVEYCNGPVGTKYANMRAENGHEAPYNVKHWCIGNEMDGPWQIGHLEAEDYGKKAREAAKMMRWHDNDIKLVLCGSSNSSMPTFPEWDRVALEICYDYVDYHSMHHYANNHANDTASYLAKSAEFEYFVDTLSGVLRYVKAKNRSKKDVYLQWDEWNVWYKAHGSEHTQGNWEEAPHLIEEVYNLEDALVVAQWMNVFLRKADVIKVACLAQIVNVIAPILTTRDSMLKQSIYYPFMLFSQLASGKSLDVTTRSPLYNTSEFGDMPLLDVSSSYNEETDSNAIFIVNRSQTDSLPVEIHWQDRAPKSINSIYQVAGTDPKAANSFDNPDQVVAKKVDAPSFDESSTTLVLPPLSFTAIDVQL
ncbi:alpha-N-arabinofuranosidase [Phototrophicus methaneseepsis]|uniref:non-reducing end alpha-L-arabinofuranosidase n=1 Tax=Phototrophicus methaneseepsis TaxID=2710758 RepID=A0A7S8EBY2_9CHLR|nr:alpha-N-arabinofuranosidase [Phototrophicus methaneseepsis]QPC84122.1 alpha-N-arabinofuranosidase [Phototrophicus methaneseepsis]